VSTDELSWIRENKICNCREQESAYEERTTFTIYNETNANIAIPCIPGKHCTVGYLELTGCVYIANIHESLMKLLIFSLNEKYAGVILGTIYKKVSQKYLLQW
jgi:hypothetical protein